MANEDFFRTAETSENKFSPTSYTFPSSLGAGIYEHFCVFTVFRSRASKYEQGTIQPQETGSAGVSPSEDFPSQEIKRGTVKTEVTLSLPMPKELTFEYGLNWEEKNKSFLKEIAGAAIQGDIDRVENVGKGLIDNALIKTGLQRFGGVLELSRFAENPNKEQIFKDVDLRSFPMSWKLVPESREESRIIANIIQMFKFHAHPELARGSNVPASHFIYPSEFTVDFYKGGEVNKWLPKIGTCAIKNFSCNYTSQGLWQAFQSGAPVEVEMSLTLQELEIITKEKILAGY